MSSPETLPEIMRVIAIGDDKTPQSLQITQAPLPDCGDDEVLVKIAAAGVNRGDCVQRIGFYPPPPGASEVMGLEMAGTVVHAGTQVSTVKPGDRVAGIVAGGGYGEFINIHHSHVLPIPDDMSFTDAAALPEAMMTVYANVMEHGSLKPCETLLVHGGASGIGSMAIQMAKAFGARVFTTVSSEEKAQACVSFGADHVINYKQSDFVEEIKILTDGTGADVILDMIGGDYIQRNIQCAAKGGRIVNIGYMNGFSAEVNFLQVMLKNLTLTGSTLRARPVEEKARLTQLVLENFWHFVPKTIQPVVHQTFALADAGAAHELMESNAHIGKIILDVARED